MLILCRIRCPHFDHRIRRLNPCTNMASCCCKTSPIIHAFVVFLLVCSSSISPVYSSETHNRTFLPDKELQKLKFIRQHLNKINKPAVKTIQVIESSFCLQFVFYLLSDIGFQDLQHFFVYGFGVAES